MNEIIQGVGWIGVLTFCLGIYKLTNGRLSSKVDRPECHIAQEGVKQRLDDFEKHSQQRFTDLKEFIKNGK